MIVGIDTRDLRIAKTGARTYLQELCLVFPQVAPEHEFLFLSPSWRLPKGTSFVHKITAHIGFYWWKEIELPWRCRRLGCDVIFCADYAVPLLSSCPTVPVFHDASFWDRPQDYNKIWLWLLNTLALPAARQSAAVVTVSEWSKQRIAKRTGISEVKLKVVYEAPKLATTISLSKEEIDLVLAKHGIQAGSPFILHVGVLEKRKNLARLVEAFAMAKQHISEETKLVLVGQAGPKSNMDGSQDIRAAIKRHGVDDRVLLTGYVGDEELPAFYKAATCYAFPSLYEGFGLPILEAFSNDLPIIAANAASIPEIAGDAALYFDPLDVAEMTDSIVKVCCDTSLRKELISRGRKRLSKFSWEETARQLVVLFQQIAYQNQES